jgi:hypothetical protein
MLVWRREEVSKQGLLEYGLVSCWAAMVGPRGVCAGGCSVAASHAVYAVVSRSERVQ